MCVCVCVCGVCARTHTHTLKPSTLNEQVSDALDRVTLGPEKKNAEATVQVGEGYYVYIVCWNSLPC